MKWCDPALSDPGFLYETTFVLRAYPLPAILVSKPSWELHPASVFLFPDCEICMKKRSDEVVEVGRVGMRGRRCFAY